MQRSVDKLTMCHTLARAQPETYIGPVYDAKLKKQLFLCAYCDRAHPAVRTVVGKREREADCVTDWLNGQVLRHEGRTWECWEAADDPFPRTAFPTKQARHRRFAHYQAIAKLLGAEGQGHRVQLPSCVSSNIAMRQPDEDGAPTKVGFKD